MTKKLQIRFIQIGMLAFTLVVVLLVGIINLCNHYQNETQSDYLLSFLVKNNGTFANNNSGHNPDIPGYDKVSPETSYETRFFSVWVSDGNIEKMNLDFVAAVSDEEASTFTEKVLRKSKTTGYISSYKYLVGSKEDSTIIVFLDCTSVQYVEREFLQLSVMIAIGSLFFVLLLLILFSKRALAPITEAMAKQKRFITDAGHELKTPLAIISANTEVMEAISGENEWTLSNRHQVEHMNELVQQLLLLSQLQESSEQMLLEEINISSLLEEETLPFKTLAESKGKHLELHIESNMSGKMNRKSLCQLISILLDNAVKYTDEHGIIKMTCSIKKKSLSVQVENPCENVDSSAINQVFERFYRADPSRSRETGGFGIGLSIASAIVEGCHGKITAESTETGRICFTAVLPFSFATIPKGLSK